VRRFVLDASVVVECLGRFAHPAAARNVLETAAADPDLELWAPDLVYPESVCALRNLVARGALDADAGAVGVGRILRLPLLMSSTAALMIDAWELRDLVTVYDACYAVLGRRLGATLITADGSLVRALAAFNDRVVHLADFQ
jgi:predicted nucleic acid-binding protein